MDPLKEAFKKIKEDISSLNASFINLRSELNSMSEKLSFLEKKITSTQDLNNLPITSSSTDKQTDNQLSVQKKQRLELLYPQNNIFSIRNKGVSTDKQTNRQTDRQLKIPSSELINSSLSQTISEFEKINEIISSLDNIKKELRKKLKSLTTQEMSVLSTIYLYEDKEFEQIDYTLLAKSLKLTESSIRDYINRLIKKGIPIEKKRLNNKKIILKISPNLRKIASLPTLINLRDL